jgi:5-methylcytosine-specific restriction endonuclease McrA
MSFVFVVNQQRKPLDPVHPARARFLLQSGYAAVLRRYPFTIIMKDEQQDCEPEPLRIKIDPGSKTTGIAVVNDTTGQVVWAAELSHRGQRVKENLEKRRAYRRSRRQRHTRYRKPRFLNRKRKKGWLPPSLGSRIQNILTWVERIRKFCPIGALSQELVRFDTQLLEHPEISGIDYQQGTLQGYETREYLLEKWGRKCVYCGAINSPLEIEHLLCKKRGGTNRESNLTIACKPCNKKKDTLLVEDFLKEKPDVLKRILAQAKAPLKDAAAVNATRWELYRRLQTLGLSVEVGTGGRTKYNRSVRQIPKTHWLDASCVGASTPDELHWQQIVPLRMRATGRHSRQMCRTNAHGFPDKAPKATSVVRGFRTGDMVRALVPSGKKAGRYRGRIAIRATGSCNIKTLQGTVQGIHVRYCRSLSHGDGYSYSKGETAFPPPS